MLVTKPILCDGKTLRVTADIRDGGSINVSVLDEAGKSIAKGSTLTADVTDAVAADVSGHQAKRVRVRFDFQDSQLYSLRIAK